MTLILKRFEDPGKGEAWEKGSTLLMAMGRSRMRNYGREWKVRQYANRKISVP